MSAQNPRTEPPPLSINYVLAEEKKYLGEAQGSALCISGGGIRSATFALGAIQSLAELGILENFDYLSTVSGGGYIGSWLTAWKQRWGGLTTPQPCDPWKSQTEFHSDQFIVDSNNNLQQIVTAGRTGNGAPTWKAKKGEVTQDGTAQWQNQGPAPTVVTQLNACAFPPVKGPDPVQHLREYNNYLSPKLGFFSADTWTLVATVARNMLLNWLVFIPLLMCGIMIPRIVLSLARLGETYGDWYTPGVGRIFTFFGNHHILPGLGLLFFALGIYNFLRYLPGLGKKDHTQTQFLLYCLGPFYLAALALITTDAWFTGGDLTGNRDYASQMPFGDMWLFIGAANLAGYLAFAVFQHKALVNKWRDLTQKGEFVNRPHTKWVISLFAGGVLTSLSTAAGAWLLTSKLFLAMNWPLYVTFTLPLLFLAFGIAISIFVGVTSRALEDDDREWFARAGAWGLLSIVGWTGLSAISLLAPQLLFSLGHKAIASIYSAGGISALISTLAGLSSKTKAQSKKGDSSENKQSGLLDIAAKLAAPVFIVIFLASLGILINWILWKLNWLDVSWRWMNNSWSNHPAVLDNTRSEVAVLLAVLFLSFSWLAAKCIDINKFSLQAMYRNRLIRAYLGASNDKPAINKFTGFDNTDNKFMKDLASDMKPFHVVNMALNLVSGKRLAWQQRKAASFTASALHCGNDELGYRPSSGYAGPNGISLGTAVAISGAAASPNMGYHSSPAVTFIMTLFNARLGSWLGNPRQNHWRDQGPHSAFDSIIREAFGLTDETSPYVYLSDGGHFENLGLYEMVRRRCRYIVVLDGGCDEKYTYEDLGNALRKIRIDMKVSIEFLEPPPNGQPPEVRFALATILYSRIDPELQDGYLIYIKPVVLKESEDPDVTAYQAGSPVFPHESTGNQWFNESQTESYRMLGWRSIKDTFQPWDPEKFDGIMQALGFPPPLPQAAKGIGSGG